MGFVIFLVVLIIIGIIVSNKENSGKTVDVSSYTSRKERKRDEVYQKEKAVIQSLDPCNVEEKKDEEVTDFRIKTPVYDHPHPIEKILHSYVPKKITFEVKGTYYRTEEEKEEARWVEVGDTLVLEHELFNEYSENAVLVCTINGIAIGYVEKKYSRKVCENIDHIAECKVIKKTNHDIPFITAEIYFSEEECEQVDYIPEEFQITPADQMRRLVTGIGEEPKYKIVGSLVKGTYELPREAIVRAKKLKQGERVMLIKQDPTKYYPNRINVYTTDNVLVGFISNFYAKSIYENFDKIVETFVESPMHGGLGGYYLNLNIFFQRGVEIKDCLVNGMFWDGVYAELKEATEIKRENPQGALELALPITDKEKGIDAKFLCCQCYRLMKRYEEERAMIIRIIDRIESLEPDDLEPFECESLKKHKLPVIYKRLKTVDTRLINQAKKKKKTEGEN